MAKGRGPGERLGQRLRAGLLSQHHWLSPGQRQASRRLEAPESLHVGGDLGAGLWGFPVFSCQQQSFTLSPSLGFMAPSLGSLWGFSPSQDPSAQPAANLCVALWGVSTCCCKGDRAWVFASLPCPLPSTLSKQLTDGPPRTVPLFCALVFIPWCDWAGGGVRR